MRILTNDEVRNVYNYTILNEGVTTMELIERVAEAVAAEITSRWRPSKKVVVFAGPGKNGADALAVSRLLADQNFKLDVYLFNPGNQIKPECAAYRDEIRDCPNIVLTEVIDSFIMPDLAPNLLIIDGLFGCGLTTPLKDGYAYLVNRINEAHATVVSIDLPSGLNPDWNPRLVSRDVIHASLTIAIQFPRLAFFIADNADLVGEWIVVDINLSREAVKRLPITYYLIEELDAYRALRPRPRFCSKADFGTAMLYAGSYGMMGAACLAARGALRTGVGKVIAETPTCGYPVMQTAVPESMWRRNDGDEFLERINPERRYEAIAVGPGIGTHELTINALEEFLVSMRTPVILDADALNCIAMRPTMLNHIPVMSILTPHAGEFDRLFGSHRTAEERLHKACEVARHYNLLVILKGHNTAIIRPDGRIYFNSTGTPAMATPGSGDVLTGMLASFVAQGYKPEFAAMLAVYLHGLAGEIAEAHNSEYGVTAGDIADSIGPAIRSVIDR